MLPDKSFTICFTMCLCITKLCSRDSKTTDARAPKIKITPNVFLIVNAEVGGPELGSLAGDE
jgi:hypothetical protein